MSSRCGLRTFISAAWMFFFQGRPDALNAPAGTANRREQSPPSQTNLNVMPSNAKRHQLRTGGARRMSAGH